MMTKQCLINSSSHLDFRQGCQPTTTNILLVDRDYLENRGKGRPRASVNLELFVRALEFRGVRRGAVFSNYFLPESRREWRRTRLDLIETRANADWHLATAIADWVEAGIDTLILISGDADFLPTIRLARRLSVRVEVWFCLASASQDLLREVDCARRIDHMIVEPPSTDTYPQPSAYAA